MVFMNIFDLVVYAIVALALIFFVGFLFQQFFPQENVEQKISDALKIASTTGNYGKTITVSQESISDKQIFTDNFENQQTIVSMECNHPEKCCIRGAKCDKKVEWDYKEISVKGSEVLGINVRCIQEQGLDLCKIYFGNKPAQSKIINTAIKQNTGLNYSFTVNVKNVGANNLTGGIGEMKLYKIVGEEWGEVSIQTEAKELQLLEPNDESIFFWDIDLSSGGKYKAEFKFEGENSGFDENSIIFEAISGELCEIDEQLVETIADGEGNYMEMHYCVGCEKAYQCAAKWEEKTGKIFEINSNESAYCIKNSFDGNC